MGLLSSWISVIRDKLAARTARRRFALARALAASGELERAAAEYAALGAREEASRCLVALADLASDPHDRFELLTRALAQLPAPEPGLILRRSRLCIDLVQSGTLKLPPSELRQVARSLTEAGDSELAAEVYALAGDIDAQAEQLVRAGRVDELEQLLGRAEHERRQLVQRRDAVARARDLHRIGSRREAVRLLRELLAGSSTATGEHELREDARLLLERIETTRAAPARLQLQHDATIEQIVLGERITVGRAGTVTIPAPSLSREHLALERRGRSVIVRDLGSRNGTLLAGVRLSGELELSGPLELVLGGDVPLKVEPHERGAVLSWADERIVAPLGPARYDPFVIAPASDGWVELTRSGPSRLVLDELEVEGTVQLCRGDAVAEARGKPVRLRVLA